MRNTWIDKRRNELPPNLDYDELGLMVGLELHQQLDTERKLYCHCPTVIRDDQPHGRFMRRLRPTQSEMGQVDPAALFEFQRNKRFCYEFYNDTTCLVEADEEPPHSIDEESIDICLTMASFLESTPVDEIHPMRKIVIDGSNTTGFQRTCIIAGGGKIRVGEKEIGIQTICLEEDAARKIADDPTGNVTTYRLDRLGIPLIEVATAPDISTPREAEEVALALGILLRSTGKVKRGLGTIRQDVNVSIEGGGIIEIKGLQQLALLSTVVELEALRQKSLLQIKEELEKRSVTIGTIEDQIYDVTDIFDKSDSKVIKSAIEKGGRVKAVKLPAFAKLVGREIQPNRRLGSELSDYAKFWGDVGGIFHTDELPKYGITQHGVDELKKAVLADENDAVIIVAAPEKNCNDALKAVLNRAREAILGVPAETRTPLPDGTTKYARPRPGAERMYPETDVRAVVIDEKRIREIEKNLPEKLEERRIRFIREHGLSEELAGQITKSLNIDLYEEIVENVDISPTLVAVALENTMISLNRDGVPTENIPENQIIAIFKEVSSGGISSEAIPDMLTFFANNPQADFEEALSTTGFQKIEEKEISRYVRNLVNERRDFVEKEGMRAIGGLMGVAMKDLHGKADGKQVRELLMEEIQKITSE
ncbi:Glu-tRNA(Gln) amidotransferase subunit GatE [Candidatus Thorarchaeota archaeon]|nr:MAG: Glu-tRNA(Gln) amidotransferase subunit GatE [Candidatus Thorarchaeota archaeon]